MKLLYISFFTLIFPLLFFGQQLTLVTDLNESLHESSGLIYLNQKLITHNDSGGEAVLYEFDSISGEVTREVFLSNATNVDWEDLCYDDTYIYVADIGNNAGSRTDLKIYRILISDYFMTNNDTVSADIISFSYADQTNFTPTALTTNFDAEALISCNDSLYIFTKNWSNYWTNIYPIPKIPGTYQIEKIDSIDSEGLVTGATHNFSVNTIVLSGYTISGYTISSNFITEISGFTPNQFSSGVIERYQVDPPIGSSRKIESIAFLNHYQYYLTAEQFYSSASLYRLNTNNFSSIDEPEKISDLIYPNPTNSTITIELPTQPSQNTSLTISNTNGQHLITQAITEPQTEIDLSHLPTGIYIVKVWNDKEVMVQKIIKQ
jgi:hypothetical protein